MRYASSAVALLLCIMALWALSHSVRGIRMVDLERQLASLGGMQIFWALVLTALGYLILASYDLLALRFIGKKIPIFKVIFVSFIGYAFSNNVGVAAISGGSVRYRLYSVWGLSARDVAAIVAFCSFTFILGSIAMTGGAFLLDPLAVPSILHPHTVRIIGVLLLFIIALYLGLNAMRKGALTIWKWKITLPGFSMSIAQLFLCGLDLLFTGSILYVLLPDGVHVSYPAFIGAFMVSNVLGHMSMVPGGLGVFETTMIVLIADHVPATAMLGSLLLFRVCYHVLPLLIGVVLLATYEILNQRGKMHRVLSYFGWTESVAPTLLAQATFIGGVLMLFSGSLPSVHARLQQLGQVVPLAVIEVAHIIAAMMGMVLMLLAEPLEHRLRFAHRFAAIGLLLGALVSLLRGLHYGEAIILGILGLAVLASKHEFTVPGAYKRQIGGTNWRPLILLAVSGSLFVGILTFRRVAYNPHLWWQFGIHLDSARFLRSIGAVLLTCVLLLGWKLYARSKAKKTVK